MNLNDIPARLALWICFAVCMLGGSAWAGGEAAQRDELVVHEWGTFTTLQDELGNELAGINTDDEPVPPFVHNLAPRLLSAPVLTSEHWRYRQKGAPRVHPRITMRLETPVLYFYPPRSWDRTQRIDASVQFRGGWLTEFYPAAEPDAPRLADGGFDFGTLTPDTTSSLTWTGLKLTEGAAGPATTEPVWLAPRKVAAADLTTPQGESERYLFYRGVGQLRSPLRIMMDRSAGELSIRGNFDQVLAPGQRGQIPALWLVHVRSDGQCAFRRLDAMQVSADTAENLARITYRFAPAQFDSGNAAQLRAEMHVALVSDGLFDDEATALLATWQRSYFDSPGLRLFYLVPRTWTERYLPLSISVPARITRVMVGRNELISDEQRALLDRLSRMATSTPDWIGRIPESPARERFLAGRSDFGDLGVRIPPDYQMYLALGRFRNALVVHEERLRPTRTLSAFIDRYGLHPFRIPPALQTPSTPSADPLP